MSFKPIDPKRDEIRRYLERGSVVDSLTKIFIRVIKERPENPMEYIRNNIGVVRHQQDKYERMQQDLQTANEEIQRLRAIINSINPEVLKDQPPLQSKQQQAEPVETTSEKHNVEPETVSEHVEQSTSETVVKEEVKPAKPSEVAEDSELAAVAEKKLKIGEAPDTASETETIAESNATQTQSLSVQVEAKSEISD